MTMGYLKDGFAWTTASYSGAGGAVTVTIGTAGSYPGLPNARTYCVRLLDAPPPAAGVTVNGAGLPYARFGGPGSWTFDGTAMAVVACAAGLPVAVSTVFEFSAPAGVPSLEGVRGALQHGWCVHCRRGRGVRDSECA